MLRVSAMTNDMNIDLQAVNGDVASAGVGIPFGPQLIRSVSYTHLTLPTNREV